MMLNIILTLLVALLIIGLGIGFVVDGVICAISSSYQDALAICLLEKPFPGIVMLSIGIFILFAFIYGLYRNK